MDADNGVGFNFREIEDRRLFSTYQKYDLDLSRGLGARVWDTAGREYLDFMAGYGVAIMGHRHPEIVKALKDQLDKLMICHGSIYNESRAKLLDELFRVAPPQMSRVFLSNSGAEAVEVALKLARKYTGKKEFIAFTGAFHGKTLGALSVTHAPKYRGGFAPLLQNVRFASFGDIASLEALDGSDVAAIIVEPVQGEGGVNIPSDDFLPAVEDKARRLGALFIVDEIQSGLGRTGKWWAHQHWKVEPDIMTLGKGIGGGIPMGATLAREDVANSMKVGEQSTTMGGNPLASVGGTSTLKLIGPMLDDINTKGAALLQGLRKIGEESRLVKEVRGKGLMLAIELRVRFQDTLFEMLNEGMISLYSGHTALRFLPPYVITQRDIDDALRITGSSIRKSESNALSHQALT